MDAKAIARSVLHHLDGDDLRIGVRSAHDRQSLGGRGCVARINWSDIIPEQLMADAIEAALDEHGAPQ